MSLNLTSEHIHEDLAQTLLIDALQKEKKEPQDIERIFESVRELEFFKNLFATQNGNANEEVYHQVCASMKYEFLEMGKFVFKEGDSSNGKFYVILSGEVGVIVQTQIKTIFDKDKEKIEERRRTQMGAALSITNLPEEEMPLPSSPLMTANHHLTATNDHRLSTTNNSLLTIANNYLIAPNNHFLTIPSTSSSIADRKRRSSKIIDANTITLIPPPITINTNITPSSNLGGIFNAKRVSKKLGEKFKKKGSIIGEAADESEDKHFEYREMVKRYGNLARVMNKGDSFGETAITKPGTNRTASILCKTDCHFLIIDEQTYKEHVKRTADRKTDTLMKTFSFLTQISSTQIRNLLVNNFQPEVFGKGHVITMEGPIKEKPCFYVLDDGLCKVEKQLLVETKNPYSKGEVFHERGKWMTICTIGHGTLIGEEILLQPHREEFYEFKVTVISKSASVLKTDKSFLGIHPDLETPIQQFYQAKMEKREEIYQSQIEDFYLKEKDSLKNPDIFLKEHSILARALRKTSFDCFNLRTKRYVRSETNQSPKRDASLNTERPHFQQSIANHFETKQLNLPSPILLQKTETVLSEGASSSNQLSVPARSSYPRSNLTANQQTTSLTTLRPSITREINNLDQDTQEVETKHLKPQTPNRIDTARPDTAKKAARLDTALIKSPTLKPVQSPTAQSVKSQSSSEKTKPKPKAKRVDIKPKKNTSKIIRLGDKHVELKEGKNLRDSTQFMAQINYLNSKDEPQAADVNKVENFKFVFEENKDHRVLEILRQKHLRLGVFSTREQINYIQHQQRPGSSLLKQAQKELDKESISKMKIFTENSIFVTNTLSSPRDSISSPRTAKTLFSAQQRPQTARNHVKEASISSTIINQYGLPSPTLHSEDLLSQRYFTTASYKGDQKSPNFLTTRSQNSDYSTSQTAKSESLLFSSSPSYHKRTLTIHCHSDLPDVSEVCKNPLYTNLMQKSINKKRVFKKRPMSGQISRPQSRGSNNETHEPQMQIQAQPYLVRPQTPF